VRADLSGDGAFSYNFRTRQGALFQIDPDSLPAPLPKPYLPSPPRPTATLKRSNVFGGEQGQEDGVAATEG
jgi:hypothetical protein